MPTPESTCALGRAGRATARQAGHDRRGERWRRAGRVAAVASGVTSGHVRWRAASTATLQRGASGPRSANLRCQPPGAGQTRRSMSEKSFDVIVIGAGPAGEVAAGRLADGGLTVAIVEPELIGGECSFYACMPSKALLRPGEAAGGGAARPGRAEAVTGELDVEAVLAPPGRGDPRPRRLLADPVAGERGHRADPRARPPRRRAARAGGRRRAAWPSKAVIVATGHAAR